MREFVEELMQDGFEYMKDIYRNPQHAEIGEEIDEAEIQDYFGILRRIMEAEDYPIYTVFMHFTQEMKRREDFVLSMSGSDWLEHLELMEEE